MEMRDCTHVRRRSLRMLGSQAIGLDASVRSAAIRAASGTSLIHLSHLPTTPWNDGEYTFTVTYP